MTSPINCFEFANHLINYVSIICELNMSVTWYNQEQRIKGMRSFTSFMAIHPRVFRDGHFMCLCCDGSKRVIAVYEQPDPVEGYKMADRVTCPKCGGTGYATEKEWREYFKAEQKNHREQQKETKRINALKKQGLKKLTIEERSALGLI
jgi:hypothetical protein